jgi:hypothetical protein
MIKFDFEEMRKAYPALTVESVINKLIEKYHLGFERIKQICYSAEEKKTFEAINQTAVFIKKTNKNQHRRTAPKKSG